MPNRAGNSPEEDEDNAPSARSATGHIRFLDLTNGEGGERIHLTATTEYEANAAVDQDEEEDDEGDEEDDGGHSGGTSGLGGTSPARSATASLADSTFGGSSSKAPAADTEHTGRWTKEEHEAFLAALQKYGKEWKKVAGKVKTRTVVQTRTHAQKYFQKLQKSIEHKGGGIGSSGDLDFASVDISLFNNDSNKKLPAHQSAQRARRGKNSMNIVKQHRRGSAATMSAAQVISTLNSANTTTSSS